MAHADLKARLVGQLLQLDLPRAGAVAVGAAAVGGDLKRGGVGVTRLPEVFPPAADRVHGELGGVVIDASFDVESGTSEVVKPTTRASPRHHPHEQEPPGGGADFRFLRVGACWSDRPGQASAGWSEVGERRASLSLGGATQHTVLAILLLHCGEVVSSERLVDELWGERPPASATWACLGASIAQDDRLTAPKRRSLLRHIPESSRFRGGGHAGPSARGRRRRKISAF